MGSGEEEDNGGLTPAQDDDDVQRPSGLPESVSALVNRGQLTPPPPAGRALWG